MAFVPRTFEQIRDDMINFVRVNTDLTDFEVGSVIRTIIEAAALEDDEQYFQMAQLLDAFSIQTASGTDLDERVADFDVVRLQPGTSTGDVVVRDGLLITDQLAFDVNATDVSIELDDSSEFPTSGFPYTARIGEGTVAVEDVTVSANNTTTNVLTVSALVNDHSLGDRVSFVSGSADRTIAPGMQVQRPATGTSSATRFVSTESGTLVNGNYESTPISVQSTLPGSSQNVGVGQISQFTSSPPFDGALVANLTATSGGRDRETDASLRTRARNQIQSLSKGTVLALQQGVLGVADPVTGKRVATANVKETVSNDEVLVYVDDGTGFVPDQNQLARSVFDAGAISGASTIQVIDGDDFPDAGYLILSPENSLQIELVEYSSIDRSVTPNVITLVGTLTNNHDAADEIVLVDDISLAAEAGQNFFVTKQYPIVNNTLRLWVQPGGVGAFVLQTNGSDFLFNRGTGDIEFIGAGLSASSKVVATYTHYTGLLFEVQRVINGDPTDEVNFPGIRAAGIIVNVATPTIRRITVTISITAAPGFDEQSLAPLVQEVIEVYISGLGISEDVIVAEIIERSMGVRGVFNVSVITPAADVVILEDELPVPYSAGGTSLVTVG